MAENHLFVLTVGMWEIQGQFAVGMPEISGREIVAVICKLAGVEIEAIIKPFADDLRLRLGADLHHFPLPVKVAVDWGFLA